MNLRRSCSIREVVLVGSVALTVLSLASSELEADIVQWDFNGDLSNNVGGAPALVAEAAPPAFAPDVVFLTEEIAGRPAEVASFSRGTYFRMTPNLPANGGGTFLNQYTLLMDVMFSEGTTGWQALFQTNTANSNDGEWFVQPNSSGSGIGISGNYGGVVPDGVWHRLVLVVDLVAGTYRSFIDGELVQQNEGLTVDGRFAVEPTCLLFADENEENAAGFVNSVQLRDEALSDHDVALLGGPTAEGIPTVPPAPPEALGLWEFDDPADPTRATTGADLVLDGSHALVNGVTAADGAVRIGAGSFYRMSHGIAPNGGGSRVNAFTLLFDFRLPALGEWHSFYQTSPGNSDDGECFARADGRLGAGATGYSAVQLAAGTWYRFAVVVDNVAGVYELFLDGERVLDGTPQAVDGRFSLGEQTLLFADDDGEDASFDVALAAVYDSALSRAAILRLGGPGPLDPDNDPPSAVIAPAGPTEAQAGTEYSFEFRAVDPEGDQVQFRIDWGDGDVDDWSPLQDVADSLVATHVFSSSGILPVVVCVRDEHGALGECVEVQTVTVVGDGNAEFLTLPYLQNVKTDGITIMWELDALVGATVEYGLDTSYGGLADATVEASGFSTYIYKTVLTGLSAGRTYHYRVLLGASAGEDRLFRTAPQGEVSFSFGVWSDSQGTNRGAYPPDPLEPTKSMMAHMAAQGVDFGLTAGDLAENGASYADTRDFYLDRVAKFLGQSAPWFNAWGNHDSGNSAVLRKFADMPSKDRPGFGPGFGSYSFDYAGCHFVCIDYITAQSDILNWLEGDLQSAAARDARFTFVTVHVPPYCELWIDGDSWYRANLVPLLERYEVDVCFSGHTHEYERGLRNGVFYCVTGGGSWLDFPESLVRDWEHMTVGGHHDLPGGIDKGLVNEYVLVEVEGDSFTCSMYAFEPSGEVIRVLDGFYTCGENQGEFTDSDGDTFPDRPSGDQLCAPCPTAFACRTDQLTKGVELSWDQADGLDAEGYMLFRDGQVIASLDLSTRGFLDEPPLPASGADTTFSYALEVVGGADSPNCEALVCTATVTPGDARFHEDFDDYDDDSEATTAGWRFVDVNNPVEASTWTLSNPGGRAAPAGADGAPSRGRFAISDSDAQTESNPTGSGMSHDLWSPIFSCVGMAEVWLHMDLSAQLNNNGKAVFDVDVSPDGGTTWSTVFRRVAPARTEAAPFASSVNVGGFFGRLDVEITEVAAGMPEVRFRLRHFEPNFDWWIAVDNLLVDDQAAPAGDTVLLADESFSEGVPAGWTIRGSQSGPNSWTTEDPCARDFDASGSVFPYQDGRGVYRLAAPFAIIDSDCLGDLPQDELLITPSVDCSQASQVYLHFLSETVVGANVQEVRLSLDGGQTFESGPVFSYTRGGLVDPGEEPFFAARNLTVPRAAGQSEVAFAFHYAAQDGWWWAIDDVSVSGDVSDPAPVAVISATPRFGVAPLEVDFDGSDSSYLAGVIASYAWDFGDGKVANGATVTHTFDAPGTYDVQLTVTADDSSTGDASLTIQVREPTPNEPPIARFQADPPRGNAPLVVRFDASASTDPDGQIDSFRWDFGDGNLGSGPQVTHRYDEMGSYTVVLTVTDNDAAARSAAALILVEGGDPTGLQRPGDCNQDGNLDLSDAVCLLNYLFLGIGGTGLPCGDGSNAHPANVELLSVNDDASIDLSDPVALLNFLFLGGPAHPLGVDCVAIGDCPTNPLCP